MRSVTRGGMLGGHMWSARYVGAAIVAALFAGASPGESAFVAASRCATVGKTVRANAVARVFTIREPGSRVCYACSRDSGRVQQLIRIRSGSEHLEHPRLTGRYFAAEYWHVDFHESVIIVWSTRDGRQIWSGVTAQDEFARDLEVTRRGAVAWVDDNGAIRKCDRSGRATIGSGSRLTRRGRTVYWRAGGTQHSYLLRGRASRR